MSELVFTESARADLPEAWPYIAEDSLPAAGRVLGAIERDAGVLLDQPLIGRARLDLGQQVRGWPTSTPYILYHVSDESGTRRCAFSTTQGMFVSRRFEH